MTGRRSCASSAEAVAIASAWVPNSNMGENIEQASNDPKPSSCAPVKVNCSWPTWRTRLVPTRAGMSRRTSGNRTRFMNQGVTSTPAALPDSEAACTSLRPPKGSRPKSTASTRNAVFMKGRPAMRECAMPSNRASSARVRSVSSACPAPWVRVMGRPPCRAP
jgi:hypothetical protein